MIRPIYSDKEKPAWTFDRKKGMWRGWLLDITRDLGGGKRKRVRLQFPTKTDAEKAELEILVENQNRKAGLKRAAYSKSAIDLDDLLRARMKETTKAANRSRYYLRKRVFRAFLASFSEIPLVVDVTTSDIRNFARKRLAETTKRGTPVQPETVNRELTEIASALKSASHYFPELEDYVPPKIPFEKAEKFRREKVITPEEQQAIVEHFARPKEDYEDDNRYLQRITVGHTFEFACLTGARRKEIVRLRWTDYDKRRDLLVITRWKTAKSGVRRTNFTPLPQRVRDLLGERAALTDSEFIFSPDGKDSYGYTYALRRACKALGIRAGRFTRGGLTFHSARHTFITRLLEGGTDLETVRELAGLSKEMVLTYAHSTKESRRRAIAVIDGSCADVYADVYERIRSGEMTHEDFILWAKNL